MNDQIREYAGRWGIYPWFVEHGKELIHPDDWNGFEEQFQKTASPAAVAQCVGASNGFLLLQYPSGVFRVKPDLFRIIPTPAFSFGEHVVVLKTPEKRGVVYQIIWHYKENQPMYFVLYGGKRSKRRYRAEELGKALLHD